MVQCNVMKKLRIYVDTSVIGGCLDTEFEEDSCALIEEARKGKICLLVSTLLTDELDESPAAVQEVLPALPEHSFEAVPHSEEARQLRDAYVIADVVGKKHLMDAYHVALATVARADMIVSWNFKHIVHFDKIRGFNAVNLHEGYLPLEVRTPKEVV
jgi:hypothetical protein